jgi:uncharacterized protein RhaS with RHS repeats
MTSGRPGCAVNRYYSSTLARFTTPDPYRASGGPADPQSWNRYTYVQNDPVNFSDPSGLDSCPAEFGSACFTVNGTGYWDPSVEYFYNLWLNSQGSAYDDWQRQALLDYMALAQEQANGWALSHPVAPGPHFPVENHYAQWQTDTVTAAFRNALRRLGNADCASLFGEVDPVATLQNAGFRLLDLGSPYQNSTGNWQATGAAAQPTSQEIWLNTSGPFFNQSVWAAGAGQFLYFDFGTGLTGADWGALLLLHELGHLTGVQGPDAGSPINETWTQSVLDNCFTALSNGLYR